LEKTKATIEYYQKLLDKFINMLIITVGGTASTFLSYSSKPSEAKLFLIVSGIFLSIAFLTVVIRIHSTISNLISKL
jgi:uncharacterized membrane protein